MAAVSSLAVIRNYATTARAFTNVRVSSSFNSNAIGFLRPFNSHRSLFCTKAANDEEAAAKAAAVNASSGAPTMYLSCGIINPGLISSSGDSMNLFSILAFDKIIAKEIPSTIVYEDEKVLAFRDISPQAPVHVLVIPKFRDGLTQLGKAEARHGEILGHLLYAAKIVAEKEGILESFRVVINNGPDACQSVYHLHLHVLGGRQMKWPPG